MIIHPQLKNNKNGKEYYEKFVKEDLRIQKTTALSEAMPQNYVIHNFQTSYMHLDLLEMII